MRLSRVWPLLLLLAAPARGEPLKIATWNLEWLTTRQPGDPALPRDVVPRRPEDWPALAGYARHLAADVVAMQEVDGPDAAGRVFPPALYTLVFTADHVVQRVGFAIRRGIAFSVNPALTALDVRGADAAFPLRSGADVTLHLAGGHDLRLLAIHLKSGCWDRPLDGPADACRALAAQTPVLAGWIAARQARGEAFMVLGDFNRVMDGADPLFAALQRSATLRRATAGLANPCWDGSAFIDHILLGGAAISWLVPDSLRVMTFNDTDPAARTHLSDHCAVSVRLQEH